MWLQLAQPTARLEAGECQRGVGERQAGVIDDLLDRPCPMRAPLHDLRVEPARERARVEPGATCSAPVEAEGNEDLVGVGGRRGAVTDKSIGALGGPGLKGSGHCHHIDLTGERLARRDQTSTLVAALDDDEQKWVRQILEGTGCESLLQ